jgi:hypothetical protein
MPTGSERFALDESRLVVVISDTTEMVRQSTAADN